MLVPQCSALSTAILSSVRDAKKQFPLCRVGKNVFGVWWYMSACDQATYSSCLVTAVDSI